MSLLAKRYAGALFGLAAEQGVAERVAADLDALHRDCAAPGSRALLLSPDIGAAERGIVLEKLGHGRHRLVQNLIGVLQHRRRLAVLGDIAPTFHALLLEHRGELEGTAEVARPLDQAQLGQLAALASRLSGRQVTLKSALRPELLGGVRLVVGNTLYDGSLRAALDQLEQALLQATL
jgi:F-type H+-transporting ATPase subunit delta